MNRPDIRNRIDNILTELAWCVGPTGNKPVSERIQGIMLSMAALAGEIEQELYIAKVFDRFNAAANCMVDHLRDEEMHKLKAELETSRKAEEAKG